ncbi:hypothetical protein P1X14_01075 [Sphingomonas sp. AOB5]|uniref:hypothetical protein n=1 Tax=Sphingomonas sp. AOB5 TaxID=3034017 RepID=UPI0023F92A80|nr:hypothetical protein [Sphingomonas sp. AOB5]MDF7773825.1 hypothetical protein [Sphingomonas sp. AOB5]
MTMTSILLAALAATTPIQSGVPDNCSLTVAFGSYAMGIDQPTLARTERLLRRDAGVRRTTSHRWGREGEVTLCVITKRASDARRLFQRIKTTLPRNPRGPVTLETKSGLKFTMSNPPR